MAKFFHCLLLVILGLSLTACFNRELDEQSLLFKELKGKSATEIYEKAQKEFKEKNYDDAILTYEALNGLHPFSIHAESARLQTMYCYYHQQKMDEAIQAAEKFIQLYPNSTDIDTVWYFKAKALLYRNQNKLLQFIKADFSHRDPTTFLAAKAELAEFLKRFPKSPHIEKVKEKLNMIYDNLAKHEYNIADYYFQKKAYLAALNRSIAILQKYPDAKIIEQVTLLHQKAKAYLESIQDESNT